MDPSKPVFSVRADTTPQWQFDPCPEVYTGNVIVHDVQRWLEDVGWRADLEEEPITECPACQTKEEQCDVCHGAGYTWQQDPAGREDSEPLQQQCEACFQNVFTEETTDGRENF